MRKTYRPGQLGLRLAGSLLATSMAKWSRGASPLLYLTAGLIVACLGLGGGTRQGFLSDAVLQLLAIPVLLLALWSLLEMPLSKSALAALGFCLALAVLPIVQLLPLPPWLWTSLPGRSSIANTYEIIGGALPWRPISVSPEATWVSGLALIPPLAIFVSTLLVSYRDRRRLSLVVLSFGVLSVFIGLMQVAQGPESSLRFYQFTNRSEAVGFFANRNHFAALTYCLTLLAAAWTGHATLVANEANRDALHTSSIIAAIGSFTLIVVLLVGASMARSRAGLGLTMVALFAAFVLVILDRRARTLGSDRSTMSRIYRHKVFLVAVTLAVILVVQFALYKILGRFDDPLLGARVPFFQNTVKAAIANMPFGSGLGTFVPVYALFEKPEDALPNIYANHAHNEIVQVGLETGLVGIFLMAGFAFWFVARAARIWRSVPVGVRDIDWSLARAATIIVVLVIAHSLVDYPLHTGAMMAIGAFACGLMTEPIITEEKMAPPRQRRAGHRRDESKRPSPEALVTPAAEPPSEPLVQHTAWGADIVWPQEWSNSSDGDLEDHRSGSPQTDSLKK